MSERKRSDNPMPCGASMGHDVALFALGIAFGALVTALLVSSWNG